MSLYLKKFAKYMQAYDGFYVDEVHYHLPACNNLLPSWNVECETIYTISGLENRASILTCILYTNKSLRLRVLDKKSFVLEVFARQNKTEAVASCKRCLLTRSSFHSMGLHVSTFC
jgi:hypothetical protein